MDTTVITLKDVPKELRDRFKAACALRGTSMREAILSFMRDFAERKEGRK